jgi:dsDNA-binding SOS-regulon protein
MAVIVKYVVVRDGKEDMIFTTKKEADAYDKMLDIAEQLHDFILTSEIDIGADQLDDLTFFMAQHRDQIGSILKGIAPDATKKDRASKAKSEAPAAMETEIEAPAVAEDQAPDTPTVSRAAKSRAAA